MMIHYLRLFGLIPTPGRKQVQRESFDGNVSQMVNTTLGLQRLVQLVNIYCQPKNFIWVTQWIVIGEINFPVNFIHVL